MERDSWLYLFLLLTIGAVTANIIAVFVAHDPNAVKGKGGATSNGFFTKLKGTLNWAIGNIYGTN